MDTAGTMSVVNWLLFAGLMLGGLVFVGALLVLLRFALNTVVWAMLLVSARRPGTA